MSTVDRDAAGTPASKESRESPATHSAFTKSLSDSECVARYRPFVFVLCTNNEQHVNLQQLTHLMKRESAFAGSNLVFLNELSRQRAAAVVAAAAAAEAEKAGGAQAAAGGGATAGGNTSGANGKRGKGAQQAPAADKDAAATGAETTPQVTATELREEYVGVAVTRETKRVEAAQAKVARREALIADFLADGLSKEEADAAANEEEVDESDESDDGSEDEVVSGELYAARAEDAANEEQANFQRFTQLVAAGTAEFDVSDAVSCSSSISDLPSQQEMKERELSASEAQSARLRRELRAKRHLNRGEHLFVCLTGSPSSVDGLTALLEAGVPVHAIITVCSDAPLGVTAQQLIQQYNQKIELEKQQANTSRHSPGKKSTVNIGGGAPGKDNRVGSAGKDPNANKGDVAEIAPRQALAEDVRSTLAKYPAHSPHALRNILCHDYVVPTREINVGGSAAVAEKSAKLLVATERERDVYTKVIDAILTLEKQWRQYQAWKQTRRVITIPSCLRDDTQINSPMMEKDAFPSTAGGESSGSRHSTSRSVSLGASGNKTGKTSPSRGASAGPSSSRSAGGGSRPSQAVANEDALSRGRKRSRASVIFQSIQTGAANDPQHLSHMSHSGSASALASMEDVVVSAEEYVKSFDVNRTATISQTFGSPSSSGAAADLMLSTNGMIVKSVLDACLAQVRINRKSGTQGGGGDGSRDAADLAGSPPSSSTSSLRDVRNAGNFVEELWRILGLPSDHSGTHTSRTTVTKSQDLISHALPSEESLRSLMYLARGAPCGAPLLNLTQAAAWLQSASVAMGCSDAWRSSTQDQAVTLLPISAPQWHATLTKLLRLHSHSYSGKRLMVAPLGDNSDSGTNSGPAGLLIAIARDVGRGAQERKTESALYCFRGETTFSEFLEMRSFLKKERLFYRPPADGDEAGGDDEADGDGTGVGRLYGVKDGAIVITAPNGLKDADDGSGEDADDWEEDEDGNPIPPPPKSYAIVYRDLNEMEQDAMRRRRNVEHTKQQVSRRRPGGQPSAAEENKAKPIEAVLRTGGTGTFGAYEEREVFHVAEDGCAVVVERHTATTHSAHATVYAPNGTHFGFRAALPSLLASAESEGETTAASSTTTTTTGSQGTPDVLTVNPTVSSGVHAVMELADCATCVVDVAAVNTGVVDEIRYRRAVEAARLSLQQKSESASISKDPKKARGKSKPAVHAVEATEEVTIQKPVPSAFPMPYTSFTAHLKQRVGVSVQVFIQPDGAQIPGHPPIVNVVRQQPVQCARPLRFGVFNPFTEDVEEWCMTMVHGITPYADGSVQLRGHFRTTDVHAVKVGTSPHPVPQLLTASSMLSKSMPSSERTAVPHAGDETGRKASATVLGKEPTPSPEISETSSLEAMMADSPKVLLAPSGDCITEWRGSALLTRANGKRTLLSHTHRSLSVVDASDQHDSSHPSGSSRILRSLLSTETSASNANGTFLSTEREDGVTHVREALVSGGTLDKYTLADGSTLTLRLDSKKNSSLPEDSADAAQKAFRRGLVRWEFLSFPALEISRETGTISVQEGSTELFVAPREVSIVDRATGFSATLDAVRYQARVFPTSQSPCFLLDTAFGGLRVEDSQTHIHVTPFGRARQRTLAEERRPHPTDLTKHHLVDRFVEFPEVLRPRFVSIFDRAGGNFDRSTLHVMNAAEIPWSKRTNNSQAVVGTDDEPRRPGTDPLVKNAAFCLLKANDSGTDWLTFRVADSSESAGARPMSSPANKEQSDTVAGELLSKPYAVYTVPSADLIAEIPRPCVERVNVAWPALQSVEDYTRERHAACATRLKPADVSVMDSRKLPNVAMRFTLSAPVSFASIAEDASRELRSRAVQSVSLASNESGELIPPSPGSSTGRQSVNVEGESAKPLLSPVLSVKSEEQSVTETKETPPKEDAQGNCIVNRLHYWTAPERTAAETPAAVAESDHSAAKEDDIKETPTQEKGAADANSPKIAPPAHTPVVPRKEASSPSSKSAAAAAAAEQQGNRPLARVAAQLPVHRGPAPLMVSKRMEAGSMVHTRTATRKHAGEASPLASLSHASPRQYAEGELQITSDGFQFGRVAPGTHYCASVVATNVSSVPCRYRVRLPAEVKAFMRVSYPHYFIAPGLSFTIYLDLDVPLSSGSAAEDEVSTPRAAPSKDEPISAANKPVRIAADDVNESYSGSRDAAAQIQHAVVTVAYERGTAEVPVDWTVSSGESDDSHSKTARDHDTASVEADAAPAPNS